MFGISKAKKVLLANIKPHFFSDSVKKDTFKLVLSGDSLTSSIAIFSITSFKGKQIYYDSAQGTDIGEEYLAAHAIREATYSQWIKAIKYRTASFFEDSNFVNACKVPADGRCGEHPELTDSANWVEIHTSKKVIGFHYFYWGVDDFYIAWSKKQQKAVMYWHNND